MELANVNHYAQVKLLFDEYNIPYEIITRGQNKGKLRVKPLRNTDRFNLIETESRLKNAGFGNIVDHSNCFRDADDNTVCTFNPYTMDRVPEGITWIKMSDYSIYGMCTKTFVVIVRA